MTRNSSWTRRIGRFICLFLLSFLSFSSNAYPAPSAYFDTVQKIYIGYYQRPADPGGLIYWATTVETRGLSQVIDAFANSAESQTLYGTINSGNISTVVNNFYLALFARNAESAGLAYWVGEFNSGRISAANIMLAFLNGAQNADLQSVNNKLAAANLFTKAIDPELDGASFQATYAGDGDVIAGRNFLTAVTSDSSTTQTQVQATAYVQTNIADASDPIKTADVPGAWSYVPVGTTKTFTTALGVTGLSSSLGSADQYMTILKIAPLTPGQRYEATLAYTGGTNIGYAYSWIDGNPFGGSGTWHSFLGIGTGTGSGELRSKQQKMLFSSSAQSTSNAIYLSFRTDVPFTFSFGVGSPSGVTTDSRDQWGYDYVDDYDNDNQPPYNYSPFLLIR